MRTTQKEIDRELERLNELTGLKFLEDKAYGQPRLVIERGPGISDVGFRVPKGEFYNTLYTVNRVLEEMERAK